MTIARACRPPTQESCGRLAGRWLDCSAPFPDGSKVGA